MNPVCLSVLQIAKDLLIYIIHVVIKITFDAVMYNGKKKIEVHTPQTMAEHVHYLQQWLYTELPWKIIELSKQEKLINHNILHDNTCGEC